MISSGVMVLPSSTPPLITRKGFAFEKSRSPFAASTTSPRTKAIADGPLSSPSISAARPASVAAILVRVFFTTVNVALSPSDWRSSPSWATVRPRYSVSTAPAEVWNRSVSSATAATFSALAMGLPSRSGVPAVRALPATSGTSGAGEGPRKGERPGAGHRDRGFRCPHAGGHAAVAGG